ncbi:hypothetical protein [Sphingobium sp. HDIP04]|uniref:hypothetical protein n=1 Tax=Sphingobium sp. HDIP04 TaxID=428994 RepID=UPI000387749C|nr:hypothetical protein [Sphingobium sp. HDIP04]EQA97267.1 hypothetical protein L286_23360 [Sphingobium sp. HDIP04]
MNISTLLNVLPVVGPVIAKAPEFVALYQAAASLLNDPDQATAKEALADIQVDNDEGHARLQAKLAAVAAADD